ARRRPQWPLRQVRWPADRGPAAVPALSERRSRRGWRHDPARFVVRERLPAPDHPIDPRLARHCTRWQPARMAQPSKQSPQGKLMVFAASTRTGSPNGKLAELVADHARARGAVVDLAAMSEFDTPLYNGDLEASHGIPDGAKELQRRLLANDAFVIV